MKTKIILSLTTLMVSNSFSQNSKADGFRVSLGGSVRMNYKTDASFTGKTPNFMAASLPTSSQLHKNLNSPTSAGEFVDWQVHSSLVDEAANSFSVVETVSSPTQTGGSLSSEQNLNALDINIESPLYQNGNFSISAGLGFSYMPSQSVLNGNAPGSFFQNSRETVYAPFDPNKMITQNKVIDPNTGEVWYVAKPGFVKDVNVLGSTANITQSLTGERLISDLSSSEISLLLHPEYSIGCVAVGMRFGAVLGAVSSDSEASMICEKNGNSQRIKFSDSEDVVYAQAVLGGTLHIMCTDNIGFQVWGDARIGSPSISTEVGPYDLETDLNRYAFGFACTFKF